MLASAAATTADGGCELLLSQLPAAAGQCLRLCAIPHQFDREILAALQPDLAVEEREAIYCRLERLALVSPRGAMLAIHDTARKYLFNKWLTAEGGAFQEASERLRAFFARQEAGTTGQAQSDTLRRRMFHWIGADQPAGVAEFERLCRADRKAARLSDCASLIALVHEYDAILTGASQGALLYHEAKLAADRSDNDVAERLFRTALGNASLRPGLRLKTRNRLGLLYSSERRWDDAIAELQIARATTPMEPRQLPMIIHDLAVAWRGKGNRERSERLLEEAIALADVGENLLCLATAWNSLGTLHRSFRDYPRAIGSYEKSLSYLERMNDRFRRSAVYNNLGDVYAELSDWQKSQKYFEMSLEVSRAAADTVGQAKTLTNLMRVYSNSQRKDEAISAGTTAFQYFLGLRDEFNAAAAILRIAKIHRSAKRVSQALEGYGKAIELYEAAGDKQAAQDVELERATLIKPLGLPWWAWVFPLLLLLLATAIIVLIARS